MKDTKAKKEFLKKYVTLTKLHNENIDSYYKRLSCYGNPLILGEDLNEECFKYFITQTIQEIRKNDHYSKIEDIKFYKSHPVFLYEKKYSNEELIFLQELFDKNPEYVELFPYIETSKIKNGIFTDDNLTSIKYLKSDFLKFFLHEHPRFLFFIDNPSYEDIDKAVSTIFQSIQATYSLDVIPFIENCLLLYQGETLLPGYLTLTDGQAIKINWKQDERKYVYESLKKFYSRDVFNKHPLYLRFNRKNKNILIKFILEVDFDICQTLNKNNFLGVLEYYIANDKDIFELPLTTEMLNSLTLSSKIKIYPKIKNSNFNLALIYGKYDFQREFKNKKKLKQIQKDIQKKLFIRIFKYGSSIQGKKQLQEILLDLKYIGFDFSIKVVEELFLTYPKEFYNDILNIVT